MGETDSRQTDRQRQKPSQTYKERMRKKQRDVRSHRLAHACVHATKTDRDIPAIRQEDRHNTNGSI